jgi:hypothetical protein
MGWWGDKCVWGKEVMALTRKAEAIEREPRQRYRARTSI